MPLRKEMVHKPKYCQRVESDSEKIALNCLLLLIVTGFRSVEVFYLRHDALAKRQIDDPTLPP